MQQQHITVLTWHSTTRWPSAIGSPPFPTKLYTLRSPVAAMYSSKVPEYVPLPRGAKVRAYVLLLLAGTDTSLGPEKPLPVKVAEAVKAASVVFTRVTSCNTWDADSVVAQDVIKSLPASVGN